MLTWIFYEKWLFQHTKNHLTRVALIDIFAYLNVWLNRRQWIFMSASEFSLLQHDPFKSMKRIWHSQIQNGKGRSILIAISVNCGCLSLILYQNLTSDNFLKVSCSVESEIVLINFYTLTLRFICLSCTLNLEVTGSFHSFSRRKYLLNTEIWITIVCLSVVVSSNNDIPACISHRGTQFL